MKALASVLEDCADLVEIVMQWMSCSPTAREFDPEIGTLAGCHPGAGPALKYHRYNVHFEPAWFQKHMDMKLDRSVLDNLAKMDKPENMKQLEELGHEAARRFIDPKHFED